MLTHESFVVETRLRGCCHEGRRRVEPALEEKENRRGLGTGLRKPSTANTAPIASLEVEAFLDDVVRLLLGDLNTSETIVETNKAREIHKLVKGLGENESTVVVQTDKTNSFRVVDKAKYIEWVEGHLKKNAKEVSTEKLVSIFNEANKLLSEIDEVLSYGEDGFICFTLETRAVPMPKLLIKDHKEANDDGVFPTRLICPATNFTSGFPKAGYRGIKKILDENEVNYTKSTIIQASQLKTSLEKLQLKESEVTIVSFDAVEMYPSIKYKLVRKAVQYFAKDLDADARERINVCLEMIKFGMGNTLLMFMDKYYEYAGDEETDERGLMIGGYESAWLADLVAGYVLECTSDHFKKTKLKGIYRDDGLVVFDGDLKKGDVGAWLNEFQGSVNELAGSDFLRFTAEVWGKDKDDDSVHEMVKVCKRESFPYLDMEMYWSKGGDLHFRVHMKENQQLKYLNKGSTHTEGCFKAIPNGVLKRLASLTTRTVESELQRMDELYPLHAKALRAAKLAPVEFPTLGVVLDDIADQTKAKQMRAKEEEKGKRKDRRTI